MTPVITHALVLLLAAPASARPSETVGVVAVAPPPGPRSDLVELTSQLRQAIASRVAPDRGVEVLEAGQLRGRMGGQPGGSSLAETENSYQAANAAAASDPQRATAMLRATLQDLEAMPDGDEVFRQWTRTILRLAKLESELANHEEQTRALVERLLRAAPSTKVDPFVYGPALAQQVEAVRAQLSALPKQRLTITSPAKEVRVFVNGRDVGPAPQTLTLPRGQYKVSASRGTLRTPPLQVDLGTRDQTVALDFTVPEILQPSPGPALALPPRDLATDRSRIIAAGGYLGLDTLVATHLIEESGGVSYLAGTLYDVRGGKMKVAGVIRLVNGQVPQPGGMAALADFLLGKETPLGMVAPYSPDKPVPQLPEPQVARGEKSKALGWAAFSTGVATVALGGVSVWQAISASNNYSSAKALLRPDGSLPPDRTQYDAYNSSGDSASRVALITGVGAGACAVATGIMGYLAYKQTGEIGPFRF